jgi:hypothetical protein
MWRPAPVLTRGNSCRDVGIISGCMDGQGHAGPWHQLGATPYSTLPARGNALQSWDRLAGTARREIARGHPDYAGSASTPDCAELRKRDLLVGCSA